MDSTAWKRIFGSIRPDDAEALMLVTTSHLEISIQTFARLEDDVVMIRGRVGGQAEGGRLFIVPYDSIAVVYVSRRVIVEEIELFSPSVSIERKNQIAKEVSEMAEKAKAEAKGAEAAIKAQKGIPTDLAKQLEELRKSAGLGIPEPSSAPAQPGAAPSVAKPSVGAPPPVALPSAKPGAIPEKPASPIPPKIVVPKPPTRPGGGGT